MAAPAVRRLARDLGVIFRKSAAAASPGITAHDVQSAAEHAGTATPAESADRGR